MKYVSNLLSKSKTRLQRFFTPTKKYIKNNPLRSSYISLALFVLLIVLSSFLSSPTPPSPEVQPTPRMVKTYTPGTTPSITVSGVVEKSGVITVKALISGVVSKLKVIEGSQVTRGQVLLSIASNYHGGNSFSLQRQIAQKAYNTQLKTYDSQKNALLGQREIAHQMNENSVKLREITDDSISDTNALIKLNESIITSLDENLDLLEADPVANESLILSAKSTKSQFLAATNQARSALRLSQYEVDTDNPPTKLSEAQKNVTLAQLDVQEKLLQLSKKTSKLQLDVARVAEGMTIPSSPFNGTVQEVFVKEGEFVAPGQPLAIISQTLKDDPITVIVYVPGDLAQKISTENPSRIVLGSKTLDTVPVFISSESVNGDLFAVIFPVDDSYGTEIANGERTSVTIPLARSTSVRDLLYVPIDSVHQTNDEAFVFVIENGVATHKEISLIDVDGSYAQVAGLDGTEVIILDRTVIDGMSVKPI